MTVKVVVTVGGVIVVVVVKVVEEVVVVVDIVVAATVVVTVVRMEEVRVRPVSRLTVVGVVKLVVETVSIPGVLRPVDIVALIEGRILATLLLRLSAIQTSPWVVKAISSGPQSRFGKLCSMKAV